MIFSRISLRPTIVVLGVVFNAEYDAEVRFSRNVR